jgi:dipeptidase E
LQENPRRKIVAIGGGEIGGPGTDVETLSIDEEIVRLAGKARPRLLFLPTASSDSEGYYSSVQRHFGERLGCRTDVLYLIKNKPAHDEIERKILDTDIIYVGGGNALAMMTVWRKYGVDKLLARASESGVVLSGLSAGSICWFRWGNSDSRRFANPQAPLIRVRALGWIKALHCPHYDAEKDRKPALRTMMKTTPGVAIALDNCCAIEIIGDTYRIISSRPSAHAWKVYWKAGHFYEEQIPQNETFGPLDSLLKK